MARRRPASERPLTETTLLLAVGALGGILLGAVVADRLGGLDGLRLRLGRARAGRRDDGWRGDERRSQSFDGLADDDSELAPEAIAHLHVHDRVPPPDGGRTRRSAARAERIARARLRLERAQTGASAPPPPQFAADGEELERRVCEAFRNDPLLAHRLIDISAGEGDAVTLTGWVRDASEQRYAAVLARGVPGVRTVHSALTVAEATAD